MGWSCSARPGVFLAMLAAPSCGPSLPSASPVADACGAAGYQRLLGQSATVLAGMALPEGTRIITADMAVTMDYRSDRLNFDIDAANRIARVHCT